LVAKTEIINGCVGVGIEDNRIASPKQVISRSVELVVEQWGKDIGN
jgi:hypothetical protein